jgi:hypothetical protein
MRRSQQMTTQNLPALPNLPRGAAELATGRALCVEVTSQGGVVYEPAIIQAEGHARLKTQIEQVDDPALDKWVTQVRNATMKIVRQHAVNTGTGAWFVTERAYAHIEAELEVCRKEARAINARARQIRSNRRTRCDVWAFGWDTTDVRLSLRIGQLLFERLSSMRDTYGDKNPARYRTEKDRCANLETIVVGEQSRLVQAALHSAEEQRPIMIAHYGGTNIPREWGDKIPPFDYRPIDAAIKLFAPTEDLFLFSQV